MPKWRDGRVWEKDIASEPNTVIDSVITMYVLYYNVVSYWQSKNFYRKPNENVSCGMLDKKKTIKT